MSKEFYVGIVNPKEVRKNLLESSKIFVQALQRYEKVKEIKEEKQKKIVELKGIIADISFTITELRTHLPDYTITSLPKKEKKKEEITMLPTQIKRTKPTAKAKSSKKGKKTKNPEVKPKTEVSRLQNELKTIETKLRGL